MLEDVSNVQNLKHLSITCVCVWVLPLWCAVPCKMHSNPLSFLTFCLFKQQNYSKFFFMQTNTIYCIVIHCIYLEHTFLGLVTGLQVSLHFDWTVLTREWFRFLLFRAVVPLERNHYNFLKSFYICLVLVGLCKTLLMFSNRPKRPPQNSCVYAAVLGCTGKSK